MQMFGKIMIKHGFIMRFVVCAFLIVPNLSQAEPRHDPSVLLSSADLFAVLKSKSALATGALSLLERNVRASIPKTEALSNPPNGCSLNSYLKSFSIEPDGAAPQLARLALYTYAARSGQGWGDAALASAAFTAAQQIVAGWAGRGFQIDGQPIARPDAFCENVNGPGNMTAKLAPLQVGRGMVYFVFALDLLRGSLDPSVQAAADEFVRRQLKLVIQGANLHANDHQIECGRYDNQAAMHLLAVSMMARYLDDRPMLAGLAGHGKSPISVNFPTLISGAIYGTSDAPRACYGGGRTKTYFQTDDVIPGEIVDRFRAAPYQMFGYTMGSLTSMLTTAKLMNKAGYDMSAYTGNKAQNLRLSLDYYSNYYIRYLSFDKIQIPEQSGIAGEKQYAGAELTRGKGATIANADGLLNSYILGFKMYPHDKMIINVIEKARSVDGVTAFSKTDVLLIDDLVALIN